MDNKVTDIDQIVEEGRRIREVYDKTIRIYYTVLEYMRLFPENTEEDCIKLANEAALKKKNELWLTIIKGQVNNM